ncbi:hypothetical protein [Pseudarthrobacter sp. MDT1-22]
MSHLTDLSSSEVGPPPQTDEPRRAEQNTGISLVVAETNQFLVLWLREIAFDNRLPSEALAVASVMARSVGFGRVALTDWQRINAALGRDRRDLAVFEIMSELELEGYLDRDVDDPFVYGWTLLIPEEEL